MDQVSIERGTGQYIKRQPAKEESKMRHVSALGIILATAMVASAVFAQTEPKVFVAPNKGQSKDQQSKDTAECRQIATEQAPPPQTPTGAGTHARGTAKGAAKGAAAGAAVGAIAGDAGKGAAAGAAVGGVKGRRGSKKGQEAAQAGAQNDWVRAFSACMESRGYTVK
jgi:OmpA family protein